MFETTPFVRRKERADIVVRVVLGLMTGALVLPLIWASAVNSSAEQPVSIRV